MTHSVESSVDGAPVADSSPVGAAVEPSESADGDSSRREQLRAKSAAALLKVEATAPDSIGSRIRAFRERLRTRRALDTAWKVMVLALGLTLLVAGAIMFVIPGPGFATIILGLVILGTEFTWATRALNPVKDAAKRAAAAATDPRRRRRNLMVGAAVGVLIGVVVGWYLITYGFTIAPLMDLVNVVF